MPTPSSISPWVTGDRREHHVNDRPRNAPTRTALGIAVIAFYGILWAEGANDLIANYLDVPLYWITWAARVGIFVGPVIAYTITKRICLGLQRKDRRRAALVGSVVSAGAKAACSLGQRTSVYSLRSSCTTSG